MAQAALFWRGMEAIRKFIDWAGPAVYVVMIVLCDLPGEQGRQVGKISLNLRTVQRSASGRRSR